MDNLIGETIKEKRRKMKITQVNFAEMIKKKESTVRKYENGEIMPPIPVLKKMCEILDIDMAVLLKESGAGNNASEINPEYYVGRTSVETPVETHYGAKGSFIHALTALKNAAPIQIETDTENNSCTVTFPKDFNILMYVEKIQEIYDKVDAIPEVFGDRTDELSEQFKADLKLQYQEQLKAIASLADSSH